MKAKLRVMQEELDKLSQDCKKKVRKMFAYREHILNTMIFFISSRFIYTLKHS